MGQEWYYNRDGKQFGPVTGAELKQLAASGKLKPTDIIWKEGMAKPVPARSVTGLFPVPTTPVAMKVPSPPPLPPPSRGLDGAVGGAGSRTVPPKPSRKSQGAVSSPRSRDEGQPRQTIDRIGSYVFGSLLFAFFVGVFCFSPEALPEFKQRMLAVSCSLLAGIFAAFMTGNLGIKVAGISSPLGKVGLRASGGMGVFVLVMVWWLSPLAPVKPGLDIKTDDLHFVPIAGQVSCRSRDATGIEYSFDKTGWKPVEQSWNNSTEFQGVNSIGGRANPQELKRHNKVYVRVIKPGGRGPVREFEYDPSDIITSSEDVLSQFITKSKRDSELRDSVNRKLLQEGKKSFENKKVSEDEFKSLGSSSTLRELVLTNATFDEDDLRHLNRSMITLLRLNKTSLTDKGSRHLAGLQRLETLDVSGTSITDAAFGAIADLPALKELDLSNTNVTDKGVGSFIEARGGMTLPGGAGIIMAGFPSWKLKTINVKGTKLTSEGVKKLKAAFNCEVISSFTGTKPAGNPPPGNPSLEVSFHREVRQLSSHREVGHKRVSQVRQYSVSAEPQSSLDGSVQR